MVPVVREFIQACSHCSQMSQQLYGRCQWECEVTGYHIERDGVGNLVQIYAKYATFFLWCCGPTRAMVSSFLRFPDHTQRRITVGRTPLDEWSVRRRYLYLTTHNAHNRQTFMPLVGFEPTISAGERPQTYAIDRAATGTDKYAI